MEKNRVKIILFLLEGLSKELGVLVPLEELEKLTKGIFTKKELEDFVEKLRDEGEIMIPKTGYVQVKELL